MKTQNARYSILLLLIVMFAAPGIGAYLFYNHPEWLGTSRTNKGTLLAHPLQLSSVANDSKWHLVFWAPDLCDKQCIAQLNVLARVRFALGRKFYQVEETLLLGQEQNETPSLLQSALKETLFKVNHLSASEIQQLNQLSPTPQIFIMNPDNYLILSYQSGVNPDDVYKDIKLLLNISESKKG